jgi:REP element-mobilizing transposase RayT
MARPLRNTEAGKVHLITCRTNQAEILFVPEAKLNHILGGIIAFYAIKYKITIYAVIILGNHYHILCSGPEAKIPLFAENINREMAHRTNRLLSRRGFLWGRRYDDQLTIENVDALEALIYITTNPVRHGLVSHPKHWPGVSTYPQLLGKKPKVFGFFNYIEYRKAKSKDPFVSLKDFETKVPLEIKAIPIYKNLLEEERISKINKLIEDKVKYYQKQRKAEGKGFLGRKNVCAQRRKGTFPHDSSNSPRPPCYSKDPNIIREFAEAEQVRTVWYKKSSRRFRLGEYSVKFPPYCLLPPLHHIPHDTSPPPDT